MKRLKWMMTLMLVLGMVQPLPTFADEDTTEQTKEILSIYDAEVTSKVTAGQSTATKEKAAKITTKEAKKGVEVKDTISYSGLVPEEKYEITCQLVYYEANQEKVVTKTIVTKKASDTGEGTWEISMDTIKGLTSGVKYHMYEEISSKKAFEFQEGIQKQTFTQNDPYSNTGMIEVAEPTEIPEASKEVTFYGRDKYKHPVYAVVRYSESGSEQTVDTWEGKDAHKIILTEGSYYMVEYKDDESLEFSKSLIFHLANDGTIELRQDDKWLKPEKAEVSINGLVKKKKKTAAKEKETTPETARYTNMVELLILLMVALIVSVKIFCSRIFTIE